MRTPRFWQSRNLRSNLLLPFSFIYGFGAWLDRYLTTPQHASLPVISIGNAIAGGAGKTPTAMALATLLRDKLQHTPHILSRGYGGSKQTHAVQTNDAWQEVGDEALLLAQCAPTWVGNNRLSSAQAAQQAGASLLLADDALQHHALHKDISLLVVDGAVVFGNGRLLPAGPMREPLSTALARSDAVIFIGRDPHEIKPMLAQQKPVFSASLQVTGDTGWVRRQKLLAFAGIAYPQKFYDTLRAQGATLLTTEDFPDHHAYGRAEIETLQKRAKEMGAVLITTAKDAVKIDADLRGSVHVLHVALHFDDEPALLHWLQEKLLQKK